MEPTYDAEMLKRDYGMFCKSVDQCLKRLYTPEISETERDLLEKRVRVTFMMTDFSISALDGIDDPLINEALKGVDERRMKWGHYRSSTFRASPTQMDKAYADGWAEIESNSP